MMTYSISDFKVGDLVWFCHISFTPSGRIKNNIKPKQVLIKEVNKNYVKLDFSGMFMWGVPEYYYIPDHSVSLEEKEDYEIRTDLNIHISKTKEGSIRNYNTLLKYYVDKRFKEFQKFEKTVQRLLI